MIENHKNILIVDDFEDVRESLALILTDEGYKIFQASNGQEAMKVLASGQIDLMIADILMPIMDGIELSVEARKKFPELKIILISGGGKQTHMGEDFDYLNVATKLTGIDNVLKKPFRPEEIISIVNQLFDN